MKRKILAALAAAALCCGCTAEPEPARPTAPTAAQMPETQPAVTQPAATQPEAAVYEGIPLETPCGTVYIPDLWDIPITAAEEQGDPLVITFRAEEIRLYDLTFSARAGQALGQVRTDKGLVYVGMHLYDLEQQTDALLAMQETVNILLEQLALEPVSGTPEGDLLLDTHYGQLRYPAKWDPFLLTKQPEERIVEFYSCLPGHEPVLLFRVLLGIGADGPTGFLTAPDGTRTEVSILPELLEPAGAWTEGEIDTLYAMQEDMNYLLAALEK